MKIAILTLICLAVITISADTVSAAPAEEASVISTTTEASFFEKLKKGAKKLGQKVKEKAKQVGQKIKEGITKFSDKINGKNKESNSTVIIIESNTNFTEVIDGKANVTILVNNNDLEVVNSTAVSSDPQNVQVIIVTSAPEAPPASTENSSIKPQPSTSSPDAVNPDILVSTINPEDMSISTASSDAVPITDASTTMRNENSDTSTSTSDVVNEDTLSTTPNAVPVPSSDNTPTSDTPNEETSSSEPISDISTTNTMNMID